MPPKFGHSLSSLKEEYFSKHSNWFSKVVPRVSRGGQGCLMADPQLLENLPPVTGGDHLFPLHKE